MLQSALVLVSGISIPGGDGGGKDGLSEGGAPSLSFASWTSSTATGNTVILLYFECNHNTNAFFPTLTFTTL